MRRNRGLVTSVIRGELQKRGINFNEIVYNYALQDYQGLTLITVYCAQSDNFSFLEDLLKAQIEVQGCYPSFAPVILHLMSSGLEPKSRAILVVSEGLRMLFVTDGKDVLLQRSFLGESAELTSDDIGNIDATIGYAIRSFRLRVQEIVTFSRAEHSSGDF